MSSCFMELGPEEEQIVPHNPLPHGSVSRRWVMSCDTLWILRELLWIFFSRLKRYFDNNVSRYPLLPLQCVA